MNAHHFPHRSCNRRAGFSLTELLVVIGIIVLLVGLLLVALGTVQKRAKRTKTESLLQQFSNACMQFQTEHGTFPGVIPDDVLIAHEAANGSIPISATENALLHLMGGFRVLPPNTPPDSLTKKEYDNYSPAPEPSFVHVFNPGPNEWRLKVNVERIGEGPYINGKPYAPYFTPSAESLFVIGDGYDTGGSAVPGQIGQTGDRIPDLIDGWGQPILYMRKSRPRGPLVFDSANISSRPQFGGNDGNEPLLPGINCFMQSEGVGELNVNQDERSIFGSTVNPNAQQRSQLWAVILGHQAFYKANDPLYGTPRGGFLLLSAGPDGVYFSATDGPGSVANPINATTINTEIINIGPRLLDDPTDGFDDIRIYGGG